MDEVSLFLGALGIIAPVAGTGLFYSWKNARRSGALSQRVTDLKQNFDKHVEEDRELRSQTQQSLAKLEENSSEKLERVVVDVASIKTDIAWIKDELKNHRPK